MLFVYWIYEFAYIATSIFIASYVLIISESFTSFIYYNIINLTGIMIGFCLWGFFMAQRKINMKLDFFRSFFVYFVSFIYLSFFQNNQDSFFVFAFINGIALGMFWVTIHSYEIIHTNKNNRDFYSSMISTGSQILHILTPAIATFLIFLSMSYDHFSPLTFLLIFLPFIFLLGIPVLFKFPEFTPQKIEFSEIKRLFTSKKISNERLYYFFSSFHMTIKPVLVSFFSVLVLKNLVNIGILETIIGILSVFITIFLSHIRTEKNRIKFLLISTIMINIAFVSLIFSEYSIYFFIIFNLIIVLFSPIYNVSMHVTHLHSIEKIKKQGKCFYPGLLYRDFILWIGRITVLISMLVLTKVLQNDILVSQVSIILFIPISFITFYYARKVLYK